jgi:hypothetical protein
MLETGSINTIESFDIELLPKTKEFLNQNGFFNIDVVRARFGAKPQKKMSKKFLNINKCCINHCL